MKRAKVSLLALSVLAGGVLMASAAAAPKTNYVLNANVALTSWADGESKATKIDDKAIINALSGATFPITIIVINTNVVPPTTNTVTTNKVFTFSTKAKLLITKNLADTN